MVAVPDKHNMYFDSGSHIYIEIRDTYTIMVSADNAIQNNIKPVYGGLLMNRQQLQQIIDNKHLFDTGLVNAAYLLANGIDDVKIEYTE